MVQRLIMPQPASEASITLHPEPLDGGFLGGADSCHPTSDSDAGFPAPAWFPCCGRRCGRGRRPEPTRAVGCSFEPAHCWWTSSSGLARCGRPAIDRPRTSPTASWSKQRRRPVTKASGKRDWVGRSTAPASRFDLLKRDRDERVSRLEASLDSAKADTILPDERL